MKDIKMKDIKIKSKSFKDLLEKYLEIKGLDIVVVLSSGEEIELYKNREIIDGMIVAIDNFQNKQNIPIAEIKSVDMFAA